MFEENNLKEQLSPRNQFFKYINDDKLSIKDCYQDNYIN